MGPSPTCKRCSTVRGPSTKTCRLGTCQPSPTWIACSLLHQPSTKNCVALPGCTRERTRKTCLNTLRDRYHRLRAQHPKTYSHHSPTWISKMLSTSVEKGTDGSST